jgi:brefeldin A-resistance guanine nucleotide exchange factor 1
MYLLRLHQARLSYGKDEVAGFVSQLNELADTLVMANAVPISYGLLECLKESGNAEKLANSQGFFDVLEKCYQNGSAASLLFEIARIVSVHVTAETFEPLVALLSDFADAGGAGQGDERQADLAKSASTTKRSQQNQSATKSSKTPRPEIERACKAIELLYHLRLDLPDLLEGEHAQKGDAWWRLLLGALQSQCLNPSREVKQLAFTHLQRTLLQLNFDDSTSPSTAIVFDEILVGLNDKLANIPSSSVRPKVLEESKVQAASLTCKVWLQHLSVLSQRPDFQEQWSRVLQNLTKLMQSAGGTYFGEAVTESLKNVLLVMGSSDILVADSPIYDQTQDILSASGSDLLLQTLFKNSSRPSTGVSTNSGDAVPKQAIVSAHEGASEALPEASVPFSTSEIDLR